MFFLIIIYLYCSSIWARRSNSVDLHSYISTHKFSLRMWSHKWKLITPALILKLHNLSALSTCFLQSCLPSALQKLILNVIIIIFVIYFPSNDLCLWSLSSSFFSQHPPPQQCNIIFQDICFPSLFRCVYFLPMKLH